MTKDDASQEKYFRVMGFDLDPNAAAVCDDIRDLSVRYAAIQRTIREIVGDFAIPQLDRYNLARSPSNTFIPLDPSVLTEDGFTGAGPLFPIFNKTGRKWRDGGVSYLHAFICLNLDRGVPMPYASVAMKWRSILEYAIPSVKLLRNAGSKIMNRFIVRMLVISIVMMNLISCASLSLTGTDRPMAFHDLRLQYTLLMHDKERLEKDFDMHTEPTFTERMVAGLVLPFGAAIDILFWPVSYTITNYLDE